MAGSPEAEELFERGLEQMKSGSLVEGCDLIERSHALDPLPGALFTLAECRARAGQHLEAWTRFRQFLAEVDRESAASDSPQQARVEAARRRLGEIAAHLARVTVVMPAGDGDDLELFVDDRVHAVVDGRAELVFEPGVHTFRLEGADGAQARMEMSVRAGEVRTIQLARPRPVVAAPPPDVSPPFPDAVDPPELGAATEDESLAPALGGTVAEGTSTGPGPWTYTAFGIGAAGLVTGSIAGAVLISRKNTVDRYCTGSVCEEPGYRATRGIGTLDTIANVGFAVGALGVGVGLWLVLGAADEPGARSTTGVRIGIEGNRALLRGAW